MSKKILAIAYDFDGTLAPGNMQERDFIPAIKMTTKEFWNKVEQLTRNRKADNILIYMYLMLKKADVAEVEVKKENFKNYGSKLDLFPGVDGWFKRINSWGRDSGVKIEHYIISSGLREMIEGTKIAKHFKAIFASSFLYNHHGVAIWPALAINYTTKTQYLFRINKGNLNVYDHSNINKRVAKKERSIPFENIVFIGDGDTDIPCFSLLKDKGGHSIAVYKPRTKDAKSKSEDFLKDDRVNFVTPADYRDGKEIDRIIKGIIDKIACDQELYSLGKID